MKVKMLFCKLFLLAGPCLHGQQMAPPIDNFRAFEYKAASKNWGLGVNHAGELFVANNTGLLHYNGETWSVYNLPNNTVIRSVAVIKDRIYTGSYEEFGYWVKNSRGKLEYTSLTGLIKDHSFTSEEFWEILPHGDEVVFRSFSAIYRYSGESIEVVDPDEVVSDIITYNGRLLVAAGTLGLFELAGKELLPLSGDEVLEGMTITDMVVLPQGLVIGTKLNGCFLYDGNRTLPWATAMTPELREHQLNKLLYLDNGQVVFGTIKNGLYLYNPVTGQEQLLNRSVGLQNNTVLGLLQFGNQLWVAEDNGVDRIQLNNPFTYYTDTSGAVGTVYDLAFHQGLLYLGTNTGVFYFDDDELRFVNGSQGHVWELAIVDGDLLCGHNTGTFRLGNGQLEKISSISGGYKLVRIPDSGERFMQGTYNGIARYQKDDTGNWQVRSVAGNLNFPVKYLCFENTNTLWLAHAYQGLYRVRLNGDHSAVEEIKSYGGESLPSTYNIKVYNVKNQIVIRSAGQWFKYDPILDKIEPFTEFQPYEGMGLIHYDEGYFWFSGQDESREIIYTNLQDEHFVLDDAPLRKRLAPEAENVVKVNDSIYYFTLSDGFGKFNLKDFRQRIGEFQLPRPMLAAVESSMGGHPLQNGQLDIPYKNAAELVFRVTAPELTHPEYFYELSGPVQREEFNPDGDIRFQNLPFGTYELRVYTVSIDGSRSEPLFREFSIGPPWYWSVSSRIAYVGLLILLVFGLRWYNRYKLEQKHRKLEQQLRIEQQRKLAEMEKEKLEREVRAKQKELASTTMNMAQKNELILELKNLLFMNKDKFGNQQRYRNFMKKLSSAVNSEEDWKRFEVNFKELHEDFFDTLLSRYPDLTPKDLKLCAYLKMNLSSKEIAPLMGISTRGVEIHRYRLRKKLDLDGSTNISNFLITLK